MRIKLNDISVGVSASLIHILANIYTKENFDVVDFGKSFVNL